MKKNGKKNKKYKLSKIMIKKKIGSEIKKYM